MLTRISFVALLILGLIMALSSCCCCDDEHEMENDLCPDLVVEEIVLTAIDVECSISECFTTTVFTIANVGDEDAGAFNIRIIMDPSASVEVNETIAGGLEAGSSLTLTVTGPSGGNCFDPDCTISITVDSNDAVEECDENNNFSSATRFG